ncbi:hypothetical protein J2736_003690 [Paenibacillus qinlingensis]|uniref:Uncharacterized protein n=1 Tax=Paenibacillus qinlingensis TaxID=1837343 RepID=A0ABU1NYW6_9BACL|nr:hypothetical protein [Paenibacillus qinlingensis]
MMHVMMHDRPLCFLKNLKKTQVGEKPFHC